LVAPGTGNGVLAVPGSTFFMTRRHYLVNAANVFDVSDLTGKPGMRRPVVSGPWRDEAPSTVVKGVQYLPR